MFLVKTVAFRNSFRYTPNFVAFSSYQPSKGYYVSLQISFQDHQQNCAH